MIRTTIEDLIDLLNTRGGSAYFGEPVSILEHSLQAAHSAELAGAGPAAISAALLHDIGHMLHGHDEEIAHRGQDGMHEEVAAAYLCSLVWRGGDGADPPARAGQALPVLERPRLPGEAFPRIRRKPRLARRTHER